MIIGNRFLKQENMPEGNTFANKFSNFGLLYRQAYIFLILNQVSEPILLI